MTAMIDITNAEKTFTMHLQGGVELPVVRGVSFHVEPGECVVLSGPSGAGKSSILEDDIRQLPLRWRPDRHPPSGRGDRSCHRRAAAGAQRAPLHHRLCQPVPARGAARRHVIDVVAEPLIANGTARAEAREQAGALLRRLNIPERLWALPPPSTFSGGEQQRVNIAHGFISDLPILLLDEPTASLDAANRAVVVELIGRRSVRASRWWRSSTTTKYRHLIADRIVDVTSFAAAA